MDIYLYSAIVCYLVSGHRHQHRCVHGDFGSLPSVITTATFNCISLFYRCLEQRPLYLTVKTKSAAFRTGYENRFHNTQGIRLFKCIILTRWVVSKDVEHEHTVSEDKLGNLFSPPPPRGILPVSQPPEPVTGQWLQFRSWHRMVNNTCRPYRHIVQKKHFDAFKSLHVVLLWRAQWPANPVLSEPKDGYQLTAPQLKSGLCWCSLEVRERQLIVQVRLAIGQMTDGQRSEHT